MRTGEQIKAMGCWGAQDGLLSASEIEHLAKVVRTSWPQPRSGERYRVLEVGHYYGLSTYVLANAIQPRGSLVSIDAHIQDHWVKDSNENGYFENIHRLLDPYDVQTLIMNSEAIKTIDGFDIVFYDGDHAEEQRRFTEVVMMSKTCKLFIFDDRDFPIPADCCDMLRKAGWKDESLPVVRGRVDKMSPETMTLGVFRRLG